MSAQILEVERLVQLVGAHVVRRALNGGRPRLGDEDAVARVLVEDGAPLPVDGVHAVLVEERHDIVAQQLHLVVGAEVGQSGGLNQAVGDVDAEAVDAHVEPEAEDGAELVGDRRVLPVEVGLLGREQVQVPLAGAAVGFGDPGPGGAAEDGLPVVGREFAVLPLAGAEVIAVAQRGAGALGERPLEPLVLVGGVVGDDVDDDPQPQSVGVADQRVGVEEVAEHGVDGTVVGHVVAGVGLRGGVERAEPHGVHTEVPQIRQPGADALQVAHAVAVAVGEAARVHLVDHRVPPPVGAVGGDGGDGFGDGGRGEGGRLRGRGGFGGVLGHGVLGASWSSKCGAGEARGGVPGGGWAGHPAPARGGRQPFVPPAVSPVTRFFWTR